MSEWMKKYQAAADYIREQVGDAEIGIVLGSGLGDYVQALENLPEGHPENDPFAVEE